MSFTVTTVNVNGIRAAVKKRSEENLGFLDWVDTNRPDVILLQEVRATTDQTEKALAPLVENGWHYAGFDSTAKKGHAGVGILSTHQLTGIERGFGSFPDTGRWIQAEVADLGITVASLYLPSGSEGTAKQDEKYLFLDEFGELLKDKAAACEQMVIGGDWNICHRRQDIKNDKTNKKKSGFLADERAFMDEVFGTWPDEQTQIESHGDFLGAVDYVKPAGKALRCPATDPQWFDVARRLWGDTEGPYTWWTYRGKAFDTDAGWRIDYQAATKKLAERARKAWVDKADRYDLRWSDHSPLTVEYN
ncbi:exodeoxyribonuclease III [Corynebacterium mendelii]|uniref:Endonuclease/exonuclease/phosphatase family protein n=1 Tax=Corynebacterium mendelii TaxID=2765362 RepID=A0A939DZV9_9CORY|nr:exodeoxyribonuclease III [Corynebacterium mendelii]MBN9644098.1 endonuclease/exonuclease/phosphatase family protein [Corynebacterium mendelii]